MTLCDAVRGKGLKEETTKWVESKEYNQENYIMLLAWLQLPMLTYKNSYHILMTENDLILECKGPKENYARRADAIAALRQEFGNWRASRDSYSKVVESEFKIQGPAERKSM